MKLYYFTRAQHGLAAILDQRIKLSTFDNLNDPFELFATDHADQTVRRSYQLLKDKLASHIGLLCCSKSWHSTLQWAHYADRHRGVALELDVDDDCLTHVVYREERIPITREQLEAEIATDSMNSARDILKVKSSEWSYEDEARVFHDISSMVPTPDGLYFAPLGGKIRLCGLTLGPLCTTTMSDVVDHLPGGTELPVRKARIAFRSFKVVTDLSFSARHAPRA